MARRHVPMATLLCLAAAGCQTSEPKTKMDEAASLVQQRVGERPAWESAMDAEQPVWADGSSLTPQQAIRLAMRNNREVRADLEIIGQADADLLQAGLLQNPMINLMIMFPDGGGRSMLRASGLPMQPLQDLWMIPQRRKVATAELQQAVLRVADRAVTVAADVKKVYARLQYTQRAIELIRDNMRVVEQSTQVIGVQQSSGKATQVEVNMSQIRGLKLRSELLVMEAEHRASQRALLMLMGIASGPDNWKVEPVAEMKEPLATTPDEDTLVATAREQRLDLMVAAWQVKSAEDEIELMRREGWPEVSLGLSVERSPAPRSNNPSWAGQAGNAGAQRLANEAVGMKPPVGAPVMPFAPKQREVKWTIGPMLQMSIPIFDWGQGKVAKAVHMYRQRLAEYDGKTQELTRMVREKQVMLRQAADQVRFYRESIMPAVERNLDVARRSFVAGQESLTVYLQVQEDLLMTRLRILEFYRDYLVTRAELEREVGGRLVVPAAATRPASTQPGE